MKVYSMKAILIMLTMFAVNTSNAIDGISHDKARPTAQLDSVQKLVFSSSAAKQIVESDIEEAKVKHQLARDLLEKGRMAIANGDQKEGKDYLSKVVKTMFEAVRLSEQKNVTAPKKEHDYSDRMETIKALLTAYKRITTEKNDPSAFSRLGDEIQPVLDNAENLKSVGELDQARSELDKAYIAAKKAIEGVRGGDTLIRTLHFDTKEEEYRYELDRNDTHKMLITVLLKEKMENIAIKSVVEPFIHRAEQLRGKAIKLSEQGEYQQAIQELESSTQNLVRALRSAGIYIPG